MDLPCYDVTYFGTHVIAEFVAVQNRQAQSSILILSLQAMLNELLNQQKECVWSRRIDHNYKKLIGKNGVSNAKKLEWVFFTEVLWTHAIHRPHGFYRVDVDSRSTTKDPKFKIVSDLYEFRYGKDEADKMRKIFSDETNYDKYILLILYSPHGIERIWMKEFPNTILKEDSSGTGEIWGSENSQA